MDFYVETLVREVSLDVFASTFLVLGAHELRDFLDVDRSVEFAFALENQDVGLLLDVKGVVLEQEVVSRLLAHFFDQANGLIQVVVLVNGFKELTEDIGLRIGVAQVLESQGKRHFFEGIGTDLVLGVGLSSSKQKRSNHVSQQPFRSHLDHVQEMVAILLSI